MSGWPVTDPSEVPDGQRWGAVWATDLAVFFSDGAETVRRDPGWILAVLALAATAACAILYGVLCAVVSPRDAVLEPGR